MPKLDGISATSMIRRFDDRTPIISMTSNSKPNEILTYYSSGEECSFFSISFSPIDVVWEGMNDILSKPFTKTGLFEMLEVNILFEKKLFHRRSN